MQDLLKKIVEMDAQARKIEESAEREKLKSEEDVEQLKEQIYNDYIDRAKKRIEKNISVDRAHAREKLESYRTDVENAKAAMRRRYEENKENWVDEIVTRALKQDV